MRKIVEEQKVKLYELNGILHEIKAFLIGNTPEESCDKMSVECFKDALNENTTIINDILDTANIIKDTLEGDK